jgi:hypothetical protein
LGESTYEEAAGIPQLKDNPSPSLSCSTGRS